MKRCTHDQFTEEASVITDGICPSCLMDENKKLRTVAVAARLTLKTHDAFCKLKECGVSVDPLRLALHELEVEGDDDMSEENKMSEGQTKLVNALIERKAPPQMIEHAKLGYFDDYKSGMFDAPIVALVEACRAANMEDMAKRAMNGEFDGTKADSDAWAKSPDGKATLGQVLKRGRK